MRSPSLSGLARSGIALLTLVVGTAAVAGVYLAASPSPADSYSKTATLGSSVSSSSNSTTVRSAVRAAAAQYLLVWAPNPLKVCGDLGFCFINATLGFLGNATLTTTASDTTIVRGNTTTIVHGFATTIIRTNTVTVSCQPLANGTLATNHTSSVTSTSCTSSVETNVERDGVYGSPVVYPVMATAFFQDAVTGQNVTLSNGLSVIAFGCGIQAIGLSNCYIGGYPRPPPGHTYKATVFITKEYYPCSLKIPGAPCTSELLAPSQTFTVTV
jgi:hypothetical protein